ncbi:NlpC/P60 family protein [Algihabitans albus]|uniref:NlpC/P60 family protein n=1 Tax=Algihabitans albus TaxID=2164067 RepID=UPI0013C2B606|nr:NlpC/P60 family protein [Algihabitans albus]
MRLQSDPRALPAWADSYIGIPFAEVDRGRAGTHCYGLVSLVARERFGLTLPPEPDGSDPHELARNATAFMNAALDFAEIPLGQEAPGDIALLRHGGCASHVGVVIASGWMLHLERATRCLPERLAERLWSRRLVGLYRHPDLASSARVAA